MKKLTIIALIAFFLSCAPSWTIRCPEVAIICARTAERWGGKKVYLAISKNKRHVQAFYLENGKHVWMEISGNRVQAGVPQHSDTGEIITWQEAIKRWYK